MDSSSASAAAMEALLRRGPNVKMSQVEIVLEPVLEDWWWKPQLATEALKNLATKGFPRTACQVLELLRRRNIGPTFFQYNAAIHASSKRGYWVTAFSILDSMRINLVMPDLTSCSSAMSGANWQMALQLFRQLPALDLLPDNFAFNSLLATLKVIRHWQLALFFLKVNGSNCDVVGVTSAISTCAAAKAWRSWRSWSFALQIFSGHAANAVTFGAALSACDKGSQWQLGLVGHASKDIFGRISAPKRNPILCNSLISACAAGGWQWALALLEEMEAGSLQRDLWSFSGAVKACGKAGQWEGALALFSSAQTLRLGVNEVMLGSIVSACAKASQWQLAFLLVASAPQMSNAFSFCAAISGQKSWPVALHLFRMMSQTSVEGDLALSAAKQLEPFKQPPEAERVVVVSTNVAETSVTLPNVRYVVDCGREKRRRSRLTTDGPAQPAMSDGPGVDPAAALALEGPSLQRYAVRLSEVVMQQHAARKKDWKNWQGKEEELNDEIRELRRQVATEQQERDQAVGREVILEQELRAERRRRIDMEAQVTLADSWKAEAAAADRAARMSSSNAALAASAESEAAREWKRQAAEARRAEAKAMAGQQRAELAAQQARKDLNSHLEEREQQFSQRVQMARASEAEVLAEAWRMSGELRSELDAVRSGEAAPPSQDSSARQALQDLRELRQRYNDMLG
eukprot:s2293_g11.t2